MSGAVFSASSKILGPGAQISLIISFLFIDIKENFWEIFHILFNFLFPEKTFKLFKESLFTLLQP